MIARLRRLRSRLGRERGDTLVEVLITITIVGIAFTGILAGLATAINLSGRHRGQANADVVLVSAAESVKNQAYTQCASTSSYSATSGVTLPSGWVASNLSITSVKKWNGSSFVTTCPATDQGLQLITISATTPDNKSTETIEVVKRQSS
jgi:type II secretory pathway pseudopilin PulG